MNFFLKKLKRKRIPKANNIDREMLMGVESVLKYCCVGNSICLKYISQMVVIITGEPKSIMIRFVDELPVFIIKKSSTIQTWNLFGNFF